MRSVLILVENLTLPFDRRVWLECLALRDAGYKVSAICPQDRNAPFERLEDIALYRYPPPPPTTGFASYCYEFAYCFLRTFLLTFKVRRQRGFDAIQTCNPPDTFFLIGLFWKLFGVRFLFDQHDLCPEVFLGRFGTTERHPLYRILRLLEWSTYQTARVVISTNESYRDVALKRGKKRREQVFVLRTGPDFQRFFPVPGEPALREGHAHLIAYLGVMGPQDGVDYLLRAAAVLIHERGRQDVLFVLMGKGDATDTLKRLGEELKISPWLRWPGRVPDDLLRRYLAAATVCASPDPLNPLNDCSTMNKVMEYMAMGRAQVAFDLHETRVSAGEAALYATPNSVEDFAGKLEQLLDDPALRHKLEATALQRVRESLAWDFQKPHLLTAYDALFQA